MIQHTSQYLARSKAMAGVDHYFDCGIVVRKPFEIRPRLPVCR
jgi:hypothetical protein